MSIEKVAAVIDGYENFAAQSAMELVDALKEDCRTYCDIDEALLRIKQDLFWTGRQHCMPLIDTVDEMLKNEKGRLFAASEQTTICLPAELMDRLRQEAD